VLRDRSMHRLGLGGELLVVIGIEVEADPVLAV